MKDIKIIVSVETTAKSYPETVDDCKNIACKNCVMAEFIPARTACPHREMMEKYGETITYKSFHTEVKPIRKIITGNEPVTKILNLPETHKECCELSCSKCIMNEFRFQDKGGGMMVCTLKNMLNKYMR